MFCILYSHVIFFDNMSSKRLELNPSKHELILLHSSRRNPGFIQNDIELFGNFITPVGVVRTR